MTKEQNFAAETILNARASSSGYSLNNKKLSDVQLDYINKETPQNISDYLKISKIYQDIANFKLELKKQVDCIITTESFLDMFIESKNKYMRILSNTSLTQKEIKYCCKKADIDAENIKMQEAILKKHKNHKIFIENRINELNANLKKLDALEWK